MYAHLMKRLQILIEEDLDEALAREARATGTSKGALLRAYAREKLQPLPPIQDDPIWGIVGMSDAEPVDPADIDDIVYG